MKLPLHSTYRRIVLLLSFSIFFSCLSAQSINGDTSVCAGEQATYIVTTGGNSYNWNVTGGTLIGNANNDTVTIGWGAAGIGSILVTVFTNAGPVYASLSVNIHALPNPVISHSPYTTCPSDTEPNSGVGQQGGGHTCDNVCEFSTITYSTPLNAGSTYWWVVSGHVSFTGQGTNSVTVTWDSTLYGSLTVIETNTWGCVDSASVCVKKVKRPKALFNSQSSVCLNSSTLFTNLSTGATSYMWYFGDGNTSTSFSPTHAYNSAGTYTVTLVVFNDCHCSDTFQRNIIVDSLPGPDITCPATVCAGDTQSYATNTAGCTYQWGVIGGAILGSSTMQSVTVAWGPGAQGTLWLYVSGCGGLCTDTTFAYVSIVSSNDTIVGPKKVCSPGCGHYSVLLYSGATYNWSISGGVGQLLNTHCNETDVCWPPFYQGNDTLTVSYFDSFLNCGGSAGMIIRVRSEMNIYGQSPACANSSVFYSVSPSVPCQWNIYPAGPVITGNLSPGVSINWNNLPGNYLLTAIPLIPNAVCNDSAVLQISVLAKPAAPPISGDTIICPNSSYSYCSSASRQVNWLVTGGTPVSSIGSCITVNWGNSGPYTVKAFVQMTGQPFCSSDTTVLNVYSALPLPNPNVTAPSSACANGTSTFTCTTAYPGGTTFNWSVSPANGGAITSGQGTQSVTVEWGNNTGPVSLILTVTACSQQITKTINLNLLPPPVPVINQIGILCPGVPAQLNATGGAFTAYNWSGPGGYSSAINPTTITQGGIYHVTVTATSGCTATTLFTAVPQPAPVAGISTSDLLHYCIGQAFAVTLNAMSNPGYTYAWNSGPTSNPITVNTAGAYFVTVTDANNCTAVSNIITIIQDSCNGSGPGLCQPNGTISFVHPAFYGCNPLSFTNTSTNGLSYTWNFGDTTYSNAVSPTHTYTQAGFYLVTLSGYVPNTAGTDSCLLTDTAHVQVPLAPAFKYVKGCLGTAVQFTDLSTYTVGNNITSWAWSFGDLGTSTLQNPAHTYSTAGTYVVTLTVGNGSCTSTITDTVVIPPLPIAAFSAATLACVNSSVAFTDLSTPVGALNGWSWTFGDAGTSLNQNPTHAYSVAGAYSILLTVTDTLGCMDTASASVTIVNPLPAGNITAYPDTVVCSGIPVLLVAPSCAGCTYLWMPGASTNDSLIVSSTGLYTVNVTDPNGCTSVTNIHIVVNPAPPAVIYNTGSNSICLGDYVSLSTTYSTNYLYYWTSNDTFSNGNITSSVFCNSPLLGVGTFTYQVAITDTTTGCTDTSLPYTVIIHPLPVAPSITVVGPLAVCQGDTVMLIGSHPDSTVTLQWSTGQMTDTIYANHSGNYVLTATDTNGCRHDTSVAVNINPLPDVCACWTGCLDTCGPYTMYAPAGAATYQWLLNDSIIPGATSQSYTASVNGMYSIILTTAFGCVDTAGPIDLTLHPCGDSLCSDLVIDSMGCDPQGHPVIWYHVINTSGHVLNDLIFTVLPPQQNTIYGPVSVFENVPVGGSSQIHSVTFYTAQPGDTFCFKVHVEEYDSLGEEEFCCNTDTECVVIAPCPQDTSTKCCHLGLVEAGVMCHPSPIGYDYQVNLNIDACGKLFIQLPDTGSINVTNPYYPNGPSNISFTYSSLTPQSELCLTFVLFDTINVCKDTTMCFPLYCDTGNTAPTCNYNFDDTICQGQTSTYLYGGPTAGYTFNWSFTGGTPSSATGPGPHTVTYNAVGCFPMLLAITGNQTQLSCPDTICVVPPPVASVTQVGNSLYAYPAGMSYQWYIGPPNWQLLSGEVNQFFNPSFSTFFCVEVSNGEGCKDTACIDHQWMGISGTGLQSMRVYPSPADDWLKVLASLSSPERVELKLLNSVGAMVYDKEIENNSSEINVNIPLTALPAGIYVLQVQAGGGQFIERVFVQHH